MAHAPTETIMVPRWKECDEYQKDLPGAKAWLVQSKIDKDKPYRLWTDAEYLKELREQYPSAPSEIYRARNCGFSKGRALIEKATAIETAGGQGRPSKLYRVIFRGQPHGGIKPRGEIGTCPIFFQVDAQRHFNWHSRYASPFMSATRSIFQAIKIAAWYEAEGYEGIEIVCFDSTGHGWDHQKQRLWKATSLVNSLQLRKRARSIAGPDEYLLEHSIPAEHIRRKEWDQYKHVVDPSGSFRRKARLDRSARKATNILRQRRRERGKEKAAELEATTLAGNNDTEVDESPSETESKRIAKKRCTSMMPARPRKGAEI
ncbi:hypothetical protein BJ170DRAFT_15776 [Xylariales sp. AK1849]|nr:hypothetical protein BJ170DRAFT_15776 [Xylariales sp. AK1849]